MSKIFRVRSLPGRRQQGGAIMITALLLIVVLTLVAVSGMDNTVMEERMAGNFGQTISAQQAAEIALREVEDWIASDVHAAMFEKGNDTADSGIDWNEFYAGSASAPSVISTGNGNVPGLYATYSEPGSGYAAVFPCSATLANCLFDPTEEDDWDDTAKLVKGALALGDSITVKDASGNSQSSTLPSIGGGSAVANQPKLIVEYVGSYEVGAKNVAAQNYQLTSARAKRYMFRITTMAWGKDANARYVLQSNYQTPL